MADFNDMIRIFKSLDSSNLEKSQPPEPQPHRPLGIEATPSLEIQAPATLGDSYARDAIIRGYCGNCHHQNPDRSNFCMNCGKHLGHYCNHCKTNLPVHAKYCNQCGSEVSRQSKDDAVAALRRGERIDLQSLIDNFEALLIETAMQISDGNLSRASDLLKMHRTTLHSRLQKK